jgi:lipopolysaccharide transport system permease protein
VQAVSSNSKILDRPSLISSPLAVALVCWSNRLLILRLAGRELSAKWRGTMLGVFWSLAAPLLTFGVYGFAFGVIFHGRWSGDLSNGNYALILFSGVVTFSIFSETVNRAPGLILENVSYVKKVIFPLEILPIFVILLVAEVIIQGYLPWTVLLVPFILLPFSLIILGLSWLLASLGVFIRDVKNLVTVVTSLLMFMTPIFYPLSSVPEKYRWVIAGNPLTPTLDQMRDALFSGGIPDIESYAISCGLALISASVGYYWFMRTRKAFADVL